VSYATIAEFKGAVGVDDTVDDDNIQRSLDAGATLIDTLCGRVFTPQDTSLSVRVFDVNSSGVGYGGTSGPPFAWFYGATWGASNLASLNVPDVASVTAIELDLNFNGSFSTSLPSNSWMLYPLNVGQPGVVGNYTQIRLRPTAPYAFWPGAQVRVTGLWGWPTLDAPPAPVRLANILLTNRFFRRPSAPFGVWEAPQFGQLAPLAQSDPDVAQLLGPYQTHGMSPNWVAV
jgi:hypothetical protein